jgi:hypothetical protein
MLGNSRVVLSSIELVLALGVKTAGTWNYDCVCGLQFLATDPEAQVRCLALPDFLTSSGSGTGSTQPRENN